MPHGAQKLFGLFGGYGVEAEGTGQFFATKLGLPASLALVAGLIEFFGGLLLALGLFTRPAAALIAGMMAVAVVTVHLPAGFFWTNGGFEYPLFWGLVALSFVLRGGGRYSLRRRHRPGILTTIPIQGTRHEFDCSTRRRPWPCGSRLAGQPSHVLLRRLFRPRAYGLRSAAGDQR